MFETYLLCGFLGLALGLPQEYGLPSREQQNFGQPPHYNNEVATPAIPNSLENNHILAAGRPAEQYGQPAETGPERVSDFGSGHQTNQAFSQQQDDYQRTQHPQNQHNDIHQQYNFGGGHQTSQAFSQNDFEQPQRNTLEHLEQNDFQHQQQNDYQQQQQNDFQQQQQNNFQQQQQNDYQQQQRNDYQQQQQNHYQQQQQNDYQQQQRNDYQQQQQNDFQQQQQNDFQQQNRLESQAPIQFQSAQNVESSQEHLANQEPLLQLKGEHGFQQQQRLDYAHVNTQQRNDYPQRNEYQVQQAHAAVHHQNEYQTNQNQYRNEQVQHQNVAQYRPQNYYRQPVHVQAGVQPALAIQRTAVAQPVLAIPRTTVAAQPVVAVQPAVVHRTVVASEPVVAVQPAVAVHPVPVAEVQYRTPVVSAAPLRYVVVLQKHQAPGRADLSTASYLSHQVNGNGINHAQALQTSAYTSSRIETPLDLPAAQHFQNSNPSGSISSTYISKDVGAQQFHALAHNQPIHGGRVGQHSDEGGAISSHFTPHSTYGLPAAR